MQQNMTGLKNEFGQLYFIIEPFRNGFVLCYEIRDRKWWKLQNTREFFLLLLYSFQWLLLQSDFDGSLKLNAVNDCSDIVIATIRWLKHLVKCSVELWRSFFVHILADAASGKKHGILICNIVIHSIRSRDRVSCFSNRKRYSPACILACHFFPISLPW